MIGKVYGKVRDHCHPTGKYRGAAISECIINTRQPNFIPLLIHDLSGDGSHVVIFFNIMVARNNPKVQFGLVSKLNENFLSFVYGSLRFIDPMNLLQGTLDQLPSNLKLQDLVGTKKKQLGSLELYSQKISYPYKYFNSIDDY